MPSLNAVHFADGFDGPDTVALGLEAPELAAVVSGGLCASAILHSPAPVGVRLPAAAFIALLAAALGWVRPQGRSLLRWSWLAARFAAAPRRGTALLATDGGGDGDEAELPGEPEPAWARWLRRGDRGGDGTTAAAGRSGVEDDGATVEVRRPPIVLLPEPAPEPGDPGDEGDDEQDDDEEQPPLEPAAIVPLCRPTGVLEVAEAVAVAPPAADPAPAPVFVGATRRITFFSLNGGSGRTTLATELACVLAARGRHRPTPEAAARPLRVALLDLDLRSATVAVRLGIAQPTLWDYLLSGEQGPGALDRHMVTHPSGARALLGPPKPVGQGAAVVEPARVAEIVHRLECDGTHFLVFDVGADLGAVTTWVLSAVHDIYVVLTPTASGVQDAYRSTEALRRLGLGSKLRYVVNRARPGVDLDEVMGDLGGRIAARIPYDPRIEEAENGHRIAALEGDGPAAEALAGLAAQVYPALGMAGGRRRPRLFGRRRVG